MRVTNDGAVERSVEWSRAGGEDSDDHSGRIAPTLHDAYGIRPDVRQNGVAVRGVFESELPGEVALEDGGNRGLVVRHTAPAGTAFTYMERMRRVDDPAAQWRRMEAAAELLVDVLAAGVRGHPDVAAQPAARERLITWIESELADDVRGAFILLSSSMSRSEVASQAGIDEDGLGTEQSLTGAGRIGDHDFTRILLWLIDRGYVLPGHTPHVLLTNDFEALVNYVLHGALRKAAMALGAPAEGPWPELLERIAADPNVLDREILQPGAGALGLTEEQREDVLSIITEWIDFGTPTAVEVQWAFAAEPLAHNGTWVDEGAGGYVQWSTSPTRESTVPPHMLYALWVQPDAVWQTARLGGVLLDGPPLRDYLAWHVALSPEQREEWDAFADTLRPGPDLIDRLAAFRFRPAPDGEEALADDDAETEDAAEDGTAEAGEPPTGASLLLEALRGPQEEVAP